MIHKISVPVVLSVAGTLITILSYCSMEGERQMEQTRKLLADAFDKDPIKQQYCIFYVDHLLASGRISPQMTVSVLTTVAANATNDNVRFDALRMMPGLLEQKNFREELKPLLVRSISSLIPNLTEVEVLRRQVMLDIQTLVEADESYRKPLIVELSGLDRSWNLINNKPGGNTDQKQIRVGLLSGNHSFPTVIPHKAKQRQLCLISWISAARDAKLIAPERLEIRFSKRAGDEAVLTGLAEKVKRLTGEEPKLVDEATNGDPGMYEIWLAKR